MLELPFNRSGRRKKANLDVTFVFDLTSSIEGRFGDEGIRFRTLWTKPIGTMAFVVLWGSFVIGGRFRPKLSMGVLGAL